MRSKTSKFDRLGLTSLSCRVTFGVLVLLIAYCWPAFAQIQFEGRDVSDVSVTFEGVDKDLEASERFRLIAREAIGNRYSTVKIREALDRLYGTKEVTSAVVEATPIGVDRVGLRFVIKRTVRAKRVTLKVVGQQNDKISESDLIVHIDLLEPGQPRLPQEGRAARRHRADRR